MVGNHQDQGPTLAQSGARIGIFAAAMRDRTAGSPTGTTGSNDDNIRVAYTRTADSSDDDGASLLEEKRPTRLETDKYVGKGKAAVRPIEQDAEMMDVDQSQSDLDEDNVTEYSFKSEDYPHDSELEDFDDEDARSHISLSDDEPEVPSVIVPVDWRELTRDQRVEYERMFGSVHQQPLNGSWSLTENYHRFVDEQCLTYLEAFNPDEWVLPRHDTEYILNRLLDRVRMRKANIKVYGPPAPQNNTSRSQLSSHRHSQMAHSLAGLPVSDHQMLRSQPSTQSTGEPPGVKMGQPLRQPMAFASQRYQNGGHPAGLHSGQPLRGPVYPMSGQMPPQPIQPLRSNMAPPAKAPRKLKISVANRESAVQAPLPLKAPTPPYPTRDRPDQRKTVGKAGRGKTRRQAEADEFPWNRQLDFIAARVASQSKDSWDDSVYDAEMLAEMARTRVRNEPVVAVLEDEITAKQSESILHGDHECPGTLTQTQRWPARRRIRRPRLRLVPKKKAKANQTPSPKTKMVLVVPREGERRVAPLVKPAATLTTRATSPLPALKISSSPLLWACALWTS